MKQFSSIFFIACLFIFCASCEKRGDIFEQQNTAPKIWISSQENMEGAQDTLSLHLQHKDKIELYYQLEDNSLLNDSLFFAVIPPKGYEDFTGIVCYHGTQNKIIIENQSQEWVKESIQFKIIIGVKDYYNKPGNSVIYLSIDANQPPVPVIEYKDKGNRDYTILAGKSYDPEHNKIVAYEYLIGSQSCQELIFNEAAYEISEPAMGQACANPGRAGKGGTYIVATPLSQIDHIFQASGIYSINLRVKDEWGLWSAWKTSYVEIKADLPHTK